MPHDPPPERGFIDLHCHLLAGVDDGPATLEASLAMCEAARQAGTGTVVATPHANHRFPFDAARATARRQELTAQLDGAMTVLAGSEVELSLEALPEALRAPRQYTLNGSRYLLVELMPAGLSPHLDLVQARLGERGLAPILAHPERHAQFESRPERLRRWIERGGLVQVTADSLTGRAGRRIQAVARRLLEWRLVHFVASDGHDPVRRPLRLDGAYRVVEQTLGPAAAERLFVANPRAVIEDRAVISY